MKNKEDKYIKNYKIPMINLIPAIVWSVPITQVVSNYYESPITFISAIFFLILYYYLSIKPFVAMLPCIASCIMFTALFWVFADWIISDIPRILVKIVILSVTAIFEFAIFSNATLPWLQGKYNF